MRALGEMWRQDGKKAKKGKKGQKAQSAPTRKVRLGEGALRATNAATAAGYVLASELRACGVDFFVHARARSGLGRQRRWRPRL